MHGMTKVLLAMPSHHTGGRSMQLLSKPDDEVHQCVSKSSDWNDAGDVAKLLAQVTLQSSSNIVSSMISPSGGD